MRADADQLSDFSESAGVDHALTQVSEEPFGKCIELAKCDVSNHPPEHCVAKKFEPFVAVFSRRFGTPRSMGHRLPQQANIRELVANRDR
jgi:hypothetical protein